MKRFKGFKGVLIILFLAVLVIFYMISLNKKKPEKEKVDAKVMTPVEEALSRNLSTNYPQTPKEVIKYFSDITRCFYNEEYSDEELVSLADKISLLYDDELASAKNHADYMFDLKNDIAYYKQNGYTISSYTPSASTDVEYFTEDDYEWARIWCVYNIRSGKYYQPIQEVFILRKDEKAHWRIFGWQLVDNE